MWKLICIYINCKRGTHWDIYTGKDGYIWKKNYTRDRSNFKETNTCEKRPIKETEDIYMKKTDTSEKRPIQETGKNGKRPIYVKRDLWKRTRTETHMNMKRDMYMNMNMKRDMYMEKVEYIWKETHSRNRSETNESNTCGKRPMKETNMNKKRDMKKDGYIWKQTHIRDWSAKEETSTCEKRPMKGTNTCEKRPMKKTNVYIKIDQYIWKETNTHEKRPIHMKRDQYIWKDTNISEKRPINERNKYEKRTTTETNVHETGRLHLRREPWKRPINMKRDQYIWKETY